VKVRNSYNLITISSPLVQKTFAQSSLNPIPKTLELNGRYSRKTIYTCKLMFSNDISTFTHVNPMTFIPSNYSRCKSYQYFLDVGFSERISLIDLCTKYTLALKENLIIMNWIRIVLIFRHLLSFLTILMAKVIGIFKNEIVNLSIKLRKSCL
jgi:hypothetical protein